MRRRNLALCCCTLVLLFIASSEPLNNSRATTIHEDDDLVGYDEFHRAHSTKDHGTHGSGDQTSMELHTNSTDDKINSTAHDEMCENSPCIRLCCPLGVRTIKDQCVAENVGRYPFPGVYEQATNESLEKGPIGEVDQIFQLTVHNPCQKVERYVLDPDEQPDDAFMFLLNGSLYLPRIKDFVDADLYCLIVSQRDKYEIAVCINSPESVLKEVLNDVGRIINLLFLLMTFVVYSILPELQNIHGYTLRGYVGSLIVAYVSWRILTPMTPIWETASGASCKIMAFYITYFWSMANFFWLNVMCFDIWWAFGGFRSLQESVEQRERKKFVMYSIYAWGSASILIVICVITDVFPSVPKELIRPEFGKTKCNWNTNEAAAIIRFILAVILICNICLLVSTAEKIVRQKDTTAHLKSSESRRHDDNKQWFNLCRKFFILMGICCFMEVILPHDLYLTRALEGLIIFITFVWNEKIKRLLLKRFGCQDRGLFSRNSTRSGCHSSASRTCTTTSGMMSLQEKVNPYVQTNCRMKSSSDEADSAD